MKRLLCIALVFLLLVPSVALAISWGPEADYTKSLYNVSVTKYSAARDAIGNATYAAYSGDVANGDNVYFAVMLTVPARAALVSAYGYDPAERGATISVKADGVTIDGNISAALPTAKDAEQTYYYHGGKWYSSLSSTSMWHGVVTNATKAEAGAKVNYWQGDITISVGMKTLTARAESSGYIFTDGNTGIYFSITNQRVVSGAYLVMNGKYNKVYRTDTGYAVSGEEYYGQYSGLVAEYFSALGVNYNDVFSGKMYMTNSIIASNFGNPIETESSVQWYNSVITTSTLPVYEVPDVPATGGHPYFALVLVIASIFLIVGIAFRRKGNKAK